MLHINDYRTGGGCEVLVTATIDLLRSRGIDTQLFTIDDVADSRLTPLRYLNSRPARTALRQRLGEFQPEVIHLHNFYHVLSPGILREIGAWKLTNRCCVVMTAHDYHLVCPNSGGMWCRGPARSAANRRPIMHPIDIARVHSPAYVLTRRWDHRSLSHSMLKVIQHGWNYWLIDARRVIDTVICPSRFMERLVRHAGLRTNFLPHPAPAVEPAHHARYGPLRLVFAGRVEPEKGLREFLQILPGDFVGMLTIIGEGSELDRCRMIVDARGMNHQVEFLGRLPHAQTLAIIARCHSLVLPSLCLENYPLSVIEALATGTNILVCNHGGMKEIVDELGVGFTFTPMDEASLAQAIRGIERAHSDGSLNAFDVRTALSVHNADAHLNSLLNVYHGKAAGASA